MHKTLERFMPGLGGDEVCLRGDLGVGQIWPLGLGFRCIGADGKH